MVHKNLTKDSQNVSSCKSTFQLHLC